MTPEDLTFTDRTRLRQMLDAEDLKQSGGMKSFDLNKPPTPPYQFREFPCMMFGDGGATCAAHNSYERDQLRRQGWTDAPQWPGTYSEPERPNLPHAPAGNQQDQTLNQILQMLEGMQTRLEHQYNSIRELERRQAEFETRTTEEPEPPKPPAKRPPPPPTKRKPPARAKFKEPVNDSD